MTNDHFSDNDYWADWANNKWRDDNFWDQSLTTSSLSRQARIMPPPPYPFAQNPQNSFSSNPNTWQNPHSQNFNHGFNSPIQVAVLSPQYSYSKPLNQHDTNSINNNLHYPIEIIKQNIKQSASLRNETLKPNIAPTLQSEFYQSAVQTAVVINEEMQETLSAGNSVASNQPRVLKHTPVSSSHTTFTAETIPVGSATQQLTGTSTGSYTTLQATPIYSSAGQIGIEKSAQESKSLTSEQDKQSLISSLEKNGTMALWQEIMPREFWEGDSRKYDNNSQSRASIQTPLTSPIRNHAPEAKQLPPRSQSYPVPSYYHPISAFTSHPAQNLLARSLFTRPPILVVQQFNHAYTQSSMRLPLYGILRLSTEAFLKKDFDDNTLLPLTGFANPDAQTSPPQAPKLLAKPPIKIDEKNPNSVTQEEKSLTTSALESTASKAKEGVLIPDPKNTPGTKLDPTLESNKNPEEPNSPLGSLALELYKSFSSNSNSPEKNTKEVEEETAKVVAEVVTKRKPPPVLIEGLQATPPSNAPHPIEAIHTASNQNAKTSSLDAITR